MAGLFFWGIGRVHLAQALALTFIAPLISLLLAALFLGEQVGKRRSRVTGGVRWASGSSSGARRAPIGRGRAARQRRHHRFRPLLRSNIVMMRRQALAAKPLEINFFQSLTVMTMWL